MFFAKNIFIMKNLTDFCETVETGVDLHLNDLINFAINVTCPFHGMSHY